MNMRSISFLLLLCPVMAMAQSPTDPSAGNLKAKPELNATTRTVLLANRPPQFAEAEWLKMMERPVNRSLHPVRISQAMLDTVDAKALDPRFQYEMIPAR